MLAVSRRFCSGCAGAVVGAVLLLSGDFGCKLGREFLEVRTNLLELEVVAFKDEMAERVGHIGVVAARAAFRCHIAADLVLGRVSAMLFPHLLPCLESAVPCCGEMVEAGC